MLSAVQEQRALGSCQKSNLFLLCYARTHTYTHTRRHNNTHTPQNTTQHTQRQTNNTHTQRMHYSTSSSSQHKTGLSAMYQDKITFSHHRFEGIYCF